jgi:uncharacterized membrane protein
MIRMRAGLVIAAALAGGCSDRSSAGKNEALLTDTSAAGRYRASVAMAEIDTSVLMVARGADPHWRVNIMPGGLRYLTPSHMDGFLFPAGKVDGEDSSSVWSTTRIGAGPKSLRLHLRKQPCTDAFSGLAFEYHAEVTIDGTKMVGCAMPTHPPATPPR